MKKEISYTISNTSKEDEDYNYIYLEENPAHPFNDPVFIPSTWIPQKNELSARELIEKMFDNNIGICKFLHEYKDTIHCLYYGDEQHAKLKECELNICPLLRESNL